MDNENLNLEKLNRTIKKLEKQIENLNKFLNFEKYNILEHNPINEKIEYLFQINNIKDLLVIDWLEEKIKEREEIKRDFIFIDNTKCDFYKRNEIELNLLNNLIEEIKKKNVSRETERRNTMTKEEKKLYKLTKKDLIDTLIYLKDNIDLIKEFIDNKKIITPSGIKQIKKILNNM